MQSQAPTAAVGVSIKSDAYGLGAAQIAPALAKLGCKTFFVATAAEGASLRPVLPDAEIVILNGPDSATAPLFGEHRLTPALNSLMQIEVWCATTATRQAAYLHIDTGMSRLGLNEAEISTLCTDPTLLSGIEVQVVMSHLACADEPTSPVNAQQRNLLLAAVAKLAAVTGPVHASLANSAGVFLGAEYHLDLVRAGASIYGLEFLDQKPNPMKQVVHLFAKIIQVRDINKPATVGYGAAHQVGGPSRIATLATGYGDGYLRTAGRLNPRDKRPLATTFIDGVAAPVVGRVSMDLLTVDVSDVPPAAAQPGGYAELIGDHFSADDLADVAGTIGYEVLTRLGQRHHRIYRGGDTV
ncbi:MAG: alanine racemase [Alphaproteobacteria bacterium]|nr:alanine racemase [Alphaproteobacteria bacterium]